MKRTRGCHSCWQHLLPGAFMPERYERCSPPKWKAGCGASRAGAWLTAGGDATPSSSLPEKYDQIGSGAIHRSKLTVLGTTTSVTECHRHFGRLWNLVRRAAGDLGGTAVTDSS